MKSPGTRAARRRGARAAKPLETRVAGHLRDSKLLDGAGAVLAAVSGGLDSMVMLHLMCRLERAGRDLGGRATVRHGGQAHPLPVHAAHVDHRMRDGSGADAAWVVRVCADWGVPCHVHRADRPVRSEAAGRELRHRFFEEIRRGLGAAAVTMTAHTADDQAETVLFRAARGSGVRGLAGIRAARTPSVVRPLLPFRRAELAEYAREHGVPFRDDPTNQDLRWTRNRIRHEILPALEDAVPGAAGSLAALAETSALHRAALRELLDDRIAALSAQPPRSDPVPRSAQPPRSDPAGPPGPAPSDQSTRSDPGAESIALDLAAARALSDPTLTLVLRRAAARLGADPGRSATAVLVRFARESPSGQRIDVGGGVVAEVRGGSLRLRGGSASRTPGGDTFTTAQTQLLP